MVKNLKSAKDPNSTNKHAHCVANWLAKNAETKCKGLSEYRLYSDVEFVDHCNNDDWPYIFLNAIKPDRDDPHSASIYLRLQWYVPHVVFDMTETDTLTYHGGDIVDEIAALSSLCLGARLESGGLSRVFNLENDPLGRPLERYKRMPRSIRARRETYFVLPEVSAGLAHRPNVFDLKHLERLSTVQLLSPSGSIALVRAARLYQEALWIVESAPELSWLMMVSAMEVAAEEWNKAEFLPADRLKISKPPLAELLERAGGTDLLEEVASLISETLGSTKKFRDFVLNFCDESEMIGDEVEFKRSLGKIYSYRSKALHSGIPFPAPMCAAPHYFSEEKKYGKTPLGLAASSKGGAWLASDLPMNLHGFHRIARSCLINWWSSLVSNKEDASH
jgi:hypothetical protein